MAVASPCISVCRMNAQSGLCEGCLRTLDEIAAWSTMDDEGKRAVWASIARRADRLSGPCRGSERKPTGCAAP
ncbi:DUF1289 domain-containing protein [Variovorax soli]|uniref:DUF1289 domain-containing protein n=1 Tax=Variovorax soli TaxID=376815 RepID=UPI00286D27E3|nr:DUF1289 domain-containing protein [Variovorax soli]